MQRRFPEGERSAVAQAVREVETRTGSEIVVWVVGSSDGYAQASWKAATMGALVAALAAAWTHARLGAWGLGWVWVLMPPTGGAAFGYLVAHLSSAVRRALVPHAARAARVEAHAAQAFLASEVFKTRHRDGVLLFVSLFERRAIVLPDIGIRSRVAAGEWVALVDELAASMARGGRIAPALVAAVQRCGQILDHHGFKAQPGESAELPNAVRVEE